MPVPCSECLPSQEEMTNINDLWQKNKCGLSHGRICMPHAENIPPTPPLIRLLRNYMIQFQSEFRKPPIIKP